MVEKRAVAPRWRMAIVIGVSILIGTVLAPLPGFSHVGGTVKHLWTKHIRPKADVRYSTITTELPANCTGLDNFDSTFQKIGDIGAFEKAKGGTTVEATFDGRLYVESVTSTGVLFELRIDDLPGIGRARAVVRSNQIGPDSVPVSFTGVFDDLSAGPHTVSMWARASGGGTGTDALYDPGCWSSDKVLVREAR